MKTLGLLLCLALIGIGILALVLVGLLEFGLAWEDFLVYLVDALAVYGIVWLVGRSLNGRFDRSVQRFLDGESDDLAYDKGSLRTFGLLLVTLLPFLVYLLLFALFAAIFFAYWGWWEIGDLAVPVVVPMAFVVVVIGTAIGMASGFYRLVRPPRRVPFGVKLSPDRDQRFWSLSRELADSVQAKPVDDIVVTPRPGIAVYLGGNVIAAIFGRGHRTLEIGIPSLYGLTVGEFSSILAHEYGHFSNRDTQWGAFTYSMEVALVSALQATPGPHSRSNNAYFRLIAWLNPAYWILYVYIRLFGRVTSGFSRVREVMADLFAMRLYGGELFASGLSRVVLNDAVYATVFLDKQVPELLRQGKALTSLDRSMDLAYESADDAELDDLWEKALAKDQPTSGYETHPSTAVRLEYARRISGSAHADATSVSELFDDWDALNCQVAALYDQRLRAYARATTDSPEQDQPPTASGDASDERSGSCADGKPSSSRKPRESYRRRKVTRRA